MCVLDCTEETHCSSSGLDYCRVSIGKIGYVVTDRRRDANWRHHIDNQIL
jgi:hypothetical protein